MNINSWEVWYTFSTYYLHSISNLQKIGEYFVNKEFSYFAVHQDGSACWKSSKGFQKGTVHISHDEDDRKATYSFKANGEKLDIDPYAIKVAAIALSFKFSEIRILGDKNYLTSGYVRSVLSPIRIIRDDYGQADLYPIITLFENGVLLIHYKIIGVDRIISLEELIEKFVNIYKFRFTEILLPPALASLAPFAYSFYNQTSNIFNRISVLKSYKRHCSNIENLTFIDDETDFSYKFAPLAQFEGEYDTLTSINQTMVEIIGLLVSGQIIDHRFILRKRNAPQIGNFWRGRPNVHILKHENQKDTADKNEKANRDAWCSILSRHMGVKAEEPKNLRLFEDTQAYVTSALTLWVWSKNGLQMQKEFEDINSGHLIYENQMKAELLDYGTMLHYQLLELTETVFDIELILQVKRYITFLKSKMREMGQYGELRELFDHGWKVNGVPNLQNEIQENLQINKTESEFKSSKSDNVLKTWLTIFFGFLAIPTFAFSVLPPLYNVFGFHYPEDQDFFKLYFLMISSILFTMVIIVVKLKSKHKTSKFNT